MKGKGQTPTKLALPKHGGGKRGAHLKAVVEDSEDEDRGDMNNREGNGNGQVTVSGANLDSPGPDWLLGAGKVLFAVQC